MPGNGGAVEREVTPNPRVRFSAIPLQHEKRGRGMIRNPLNFLARPAGFEPATYGFVVRHSIQLSYGRLQIECNLT